MSSKTKNILIVALLIAVPVGIFFSCRADTIGNHAAAIDHMSTFLYNEPKGSKVWSGFMIKWVYQGPSSGDHNDFHRFHLDALVRLKHLERREFVHPDLKGPIFEAGSPLRKKVFSRFLEILRTAPVSKRLGTFYFESALPGLVVYAAPEVMPKIQKANDDLITNRDSAIP